MADFSLTVPAFEEEHFHPHQNEIKSYMAQQVIETENGGRIASYPLPSFVPCCRQIPKEQMYSANFGVGERGAVYPFQYRFINGTKWAIGALPESVRAIAVWKDRYIRVDLPHQKQEAVESLIHNIILK